MIRDFDSAYMDFGAARDYPPAPQEEPSIDGMQLAAGPSTTMSDAGGGYGSIKPIEQTRFERALQTTGMTLEQAGRFLDSLGQVDVPLLGKVSLADFVPFVGSAKEGSRSVLGETQWQGTPMALQQAGTGQSLTRGTGFARQLTDDAKLATLDVATNIVPVGRAVAAGGNRFVFPTASGDQYEFTKPSLDSMFEQIMDRKQGIIPKDFPGVKYFSKDTLEDGSPNPYFGKPWYSWPGVNRERIDELAATFGTKLNPSDRGGAVAGAGAGEAAGRPVGAGRKAGQSPGVTRGRSAPQQGAN